MSETTVELSKPQTNLLRVLAKHDPKPFRPKDGRWARHAPCASLALRRRGLVESVEIRQFRWGCRLTEAGRQLCRERGWLPPLSEEGV